MSSVVTLEKIVALCKRRGFVYPSAEIYGGLNGVYDFGPLGTMLKHNIRNAWMHNLQSSELEITYIEGSLLAPHCVWEASGHLQNFQDPMIDCLICKHRYRADDISVGKPCGHCGATSWTDVRQFNLMFKTTVGASTDTTSLAYLRPETAQSIFVNFKNVMSTTRVKIPFGIAQIGKAFRNEITPKQFLFRMREFEQMEIEIFCKEEQAMHFFKIWSEHRQLFYSRIGIKKDTIRIRAHEKDELSHYSTATSDIEYHFPFGWKELEGIAYRGDFDLTQHMKHSGKDLAVFDDTLKVAYVPHVVECSVGVDRLFLTVLCDAYYEDEVEGDIRVVLKLHPSLAPYKVAFMPLAKVHTESTQKLYKHFKACGYSAQFEATGSIGKRYRRQDEIGTPLCITYDFQSDQDSCVTVRHRDSMKQERIAIDQLEKYVSTLLV
jgi:glycyl-tRNA synthetase